MAFSKLLLTFIGSLTNLHYGLAAVPKAILYENEDKTGKSINYFEDIQDYGHIQSIVDSKNLSGIALLCATGVFILYNHEEFDSDNEEQVKILAGTDTCISPGSVKSLLYAQTARGTKTVDSLAVFTHARFGDGLPLKIDQFAYNDASLMKLGNIKSFILMGSSSWKVTTRNGIFCLKPAQSSDYPVCPVANSSIILSPEEEDWLSVRRGCKEADSSVALYPLDYCFNQGSGNLEPIQLTEEKENNTSTGKGDKEDPEIPGISSGLLFDSCDNVDEFTTLLRLRLTHNFNSLYQVQFPFNKAHSWRAEILDYTMEIVDLCLVDKLVDRKLLQYVREMYVYLAEKVVWKEGKGWPTKPLQRILLMGHETSRCMANLVGNNWLDVALKISEDVVKKLESSKVKDSDIDPIFSPVKGYDIVMEFVWLAINFVGALCHAVLEYATDFWMDYMNVAYNMYLQPMAEFWGAPKDVLSYYPIIFGGFGIERQHRGLAAVTTSLYQAVSLDKLQRPMEVENSAKANA